jgi:acyl-CoA dehydrogenase
MPSYKAPVEDVLFLLNDVFGFARLSGASTSSQSFAPSAITASTTSGVASAKPGRLL